MILKTTQNLKKDFFSKTFQKFISYWPSFYEKKISFNPLKISHAPLLVVHQSPKPLKTTVLSIPQVKKTAKIKGAPPEAYYNLYISIY